MVEGAAEQFMEGGMSDHKERCKIQAASGDVATLLGMVVNLVFVVKQVKPYGYDKSNEDHKF